MKKKLLLLGVLAAQSGFSQYADSCCDHCSPSESCGPCKSIDYECYPPKYYDLECAWGVFVTGDFLYWYVEETNLNYAVEYQTSVIPGSQFENADCLPTITAFANCLFNFNTHWKPGFRVGIGFNTKCDGWDVYANWTNYHNERTAKQSVPIFNNIFPLGDGCLFLENPWFEQTQFFNLISSKWRFCFNDVDLELGRRYWLSQWFTLRPFTGLRGAWIKTCFDLHSEFNGTITTFNPSTGFGTVVGDIFADDLFTNRFWGIGLLGGLQPTWYLSSCFSLFGNVNAALLWGEYKRSKKTCINTTATVTQPSGATAVTGVPFDPESKTEYCRMQPVIDLGIGLRYENSFAQDSYQFSLDLGWEHHHWFNLNQRYKVFEQVNLSSSESVGDFGESSSGLFNAGYTETQHDVGFGGLVIRARFDF